jgi:hypothetical protein
LKVWHQKEIAEKFGKQALLFLDFWIQSLKIERPDADEEDLLEALEDIIAQKKAGSGSSNSKHH